MADELKEEIKLLKGYRENGITTKQGSVRAHTHRHPPSTHPSGAELCEGLRRRRREERAQHGETLKNACTMEVGGGALVDGQFKTLHLSRKLCSHNLFYENLS